MHVLDVQASSSPLGYPCAKFRFSGALHCWSRPQRKIVYSLNHSIDHSVSQSPSLCALP